MAQLFVMAALANTISKAKASWDNIAFDYMEVRLIIHIKIQPIVS